MRTTAGRWMKALGRKHVCRSAQNGLGDLKPEGSKPLCRSLGTISSSRCHRTRDMQTLRGEAWMQARISFLMDEPNCSPPSHKATADNLRGSKAGLPTEAAMAAKVGGARRDRTDDLLLAKQALSQLSYGPSSAAHSSGTRPAEPKLAATCPPSPFGLRRGSLCIASRAKAGGPGKI